MGHHYWYTAPTVGPDDIFTGNRILAPDAKGGFPNDVDSYDIELPSDIKWIVAVTNPTSLGPQFVATTEDGSAYVITNASDVRQLNYPTISEGFDPARPPLVLTYQDGTTPITTIVELPSSAKLSTLSHPVPVFPCFIDQTAGIDDNRCGIYVYIDTSNDIILYDMAKDQKLRQITNVNALPDARIVMAPMNYLDLTNKNSKLLAVYGGATRYNHCVLGDCLEGSSLLLIQVTQDDDDSYQFTLERQITPPSGTVFEGLSPMFIEDGATIVTTVANSSNGAWLRTYDVFCGDIVSESSYIGWGWRHMLFYNNFAPIENEGDALYSMVDVLTPHVKKELEFFDISTDSTMEMRSSKSKYTTHDIGWRYLDTAISGDLNGDGTNEAILLDQNLQSLVSLQLVNDMSGMNLQEVWSMPLAGKLTSNIAAVSYSGEMHTGVALAAASGRKMRVWISPSPEDDHKNEDLLHSSTTSTSTTAFTTTTSTWPATNTIISQGAVPSSVTTSTTTSMDITSTTSIDEPYASNDGFGISFSNAEPMNCSSQSKLAAESGLSLVALFLVLFLASY